MEDRYLSLAEVAGLLAVSERTVQRWIHSGRLEAYRPGRDYRIPESAVKALLEEGKVSPKERRRSSLEPSLLNGLEEERPAAEERPLRVLLKNHAHRAELLEKELKASDEFYRWDPIIRFIEEEHALEVLFDGIESPQPETQEAMAKALASAKRFDKELSRLEFGDDLKPEHRREIEKFRRRQAASSEAGRDAQHTRDVG
jgi:excisionase family DNA binding protein